MPTSHGACACKAAAMTRRTQAERREATQARLLSSAREMFGGKGYADTSVDDIAAACGITVRPVYHYFQSKLGLFTAVTEQIEKDIVDNMQGRKDAATSDVWEGFIKNCEDPHFRQIILIDGPNLLGHTRLTNSIIMQSVRKETSGIFAARPDGIRMTLLIGALIHAALYIGENGASQSDYDNIRALIEFHSGQSENE